MPSGFHFRQAPFRAGPAPVRAPVLGTFEGMARPGRTESESVPIWLKLSEDDAAQMEQVLARPEFAGWNKAEWCLEIIQTALRYYAKRPVAEAGQARAPARPAATEPEPPPPAPEPELAAPEPPERGSPPPHRAQAAPKRRRAAPKRERAAPKPLRTDPEPEPEEAAPEPAAAAPEPARADPEAEPVAQEPAAAAPESPPEAECLHPADARDYQTGTCAVCGAILWD